MKYVIVMWLTFTHNDPTVHSVNVQNTHSEEFETMDQCRAFVSILNIETKVPGAEITYTCEPR
jgi:hypothetical protein